MEKENTKPNKKKIIGVQLEDDLYEALLDLAAEYGTTVSSVVRLVSIDYLKRYKGFTPIKKGKN